MKVESGKPVRDPADCWGGPPCLLGRTTLFVGADLKSGPLLTISGFEIPPAFSMGSQISDGLHGQDCKSARSQISDGLHGQDCKSARTQISDGLHGQDCKSARTEGGPPAGRIADPPEHRSRMVYTGRIANPPEQKGGRLRAGLQIRPNTDPGWSTRAGLQIRPNRRGATCGQDCKSARTKLSPRVCHSERS